MTTDISAWSFETRQIHAAALLSLAEPGSIHTLGNPRGNVLDARAVADIVIHLAGTTHSQLSEVEQAVTGVTPGLVRLSVGVEGIEDLKADLEAGFRAAEAAA